MADPVYTPECTPEDRYLPNPYDCSTYYQCVNGKPILLNCAPGTHFDKSLNVCNWPSEASCEALPYPT